MELTAVESFCGAGGMAIGLKNAGFTSLLAFDLNEAAIRTYRQGVGPEGHVLDARAVTGEEMLKRIGLSRGDLDLFAGDPLAKVSRFNVGEDMTAMNATILWVNTFGSSRKYCHGRSCWKTS